MIPPPACRKIAAVLLVIALPGIACHGHYAYEAAAGASAGVMWRIVIVLAYPAMLIALVWGLMLLCSPKRSGRG